MRKAKKHDEYEDYDYDRNDLDYSDDYSSQNENSVDDNNLNYGNYSQSYYDDNSDYNYDNTNGYGSDVPGQYKGSTVNRNENFSKSYKDESYNPDYSKNDDDFNYENGQIENSNYLNKNKKSIKPLQKGKIKKDPKMDQVGKKDHFIFIVGGALLLVLILGVIFFVSLHQRNEEAAREAANAKSSSVQIKQLPNSDSSNGNRASVTVDDAQKNAKDAFNFAFKVIAQTNAISGSSVDLTQLSDSDTSKLSKLFTTSQVLQDFNDLVNVSGSSDSNVYGDAGTGVKKIKKPKAGNKYSVKNAKFTLSSDSSDDYVFDVKLKYAPKGFKTETINLIVSVSQATGKLTKVEQKV